MTRATLPADLMLSQPLGGTELRLRFRGPFAGSEVLWDAHFMTCARYGAAGNFIDIGPEGPDGRQLTVVLDIPCFDGPSVHKAVIMVRQYKRLHPGRHEFGRSPDHA